jgi:FKBP-type peptidyl-prolyl cis-trans isomerase SlyD
MPRDAFPEDLEVGATYVAEDEAGEGVTLTVVEVEATRSRWTSTTPRGEVLSFDVTVRDVRDATPEELEHGHAHEDGHPHPEA